jgi:hypothetical protein
MPSRASEQHPRRDALAGQEIAHLQDQVVVVQKRLGPLVAPIGRQDCLAQGHERGRGLDHGDGAQPGPGRRQTLGLDRQDGVGPGRRGQRLLVDQGAERGALATLGEEAPQVVGEPGRSRLRMIEPGPDPRAALLVPHAALRQAFDGQAQAHEVEGMVRCGRRQQVLSGFPGAHLQGPVHGGDETLEPAGLAQQPGQSIPFLDQLPHELVEGLLVGVGGHLGQGRRQGRAGWPLGRRHDLLARRRQQLHGRALVQHLEVGRHAGLQGEAAEQGLAKGVDRLDLHAAGHVEHPGEEAPGGGHDGLVGRLAEQGGQILGQDLVVLGRPEGQAPGQAVRHLGRRRLGEGQAEDPPRSGAVQQEA